MCLRDVVEHKERCTVSDAMGRFAFAARRGLYDVSAELPGFDTVTETVDVRDGQPVALAMDLQVTKVIEEITITCVLPNFMNGYVTDAENRPVAGAQVVLRGGDEPVSSTTDSRGYFGYMFTAGDRSDYEIEVTSDGFKPAVVRGKLPPNGFRIDIKLERSPLPSASPPPPPPATPASPAPPSPARRPGSPGRT